LLRFVICSAIVLIFNLVTDLVYRLVDPRIAPDPCTFSRTGPSPLRPFDSLPPRPFDCGQIPEALFRQQAA
jgi:hypothetical protein